MFFYSPIDRQTQIRSESCRIDEILHSPETRFLLWHKAKLIIPDSSSLYFLFAALQGLEESLSEPIYLGRHKPYNYFSCHLNQWHARFDGLELIDLRSACDVINGYHLGLLFYSQGILNWHYNHRFCAKCGSKTAIAKSGHTRKCNNPDCRQEHYPKIDPAVIFSIINNSESESRILLGRKSVWDESLHSVIAGFVEPGETLENTVEREAYEETGLKVERIEYVASQPWPFPDSLMLGFSCETRQCDIKLIDHELESASWFSASEIESKCQSGELKIPLSASISWHLIDRWFTRQMGYSLNQE